jgi:hypothetical protein
MARTHKGVDFAVDDASGKQRIFNTFDEACGFAVSLSASTGKKWHVDVLIYSAAGARWWGGDDAVEDYEDDPDASVSDRIVIAADAQGRIR